MTKTVHGLPDVDRSRAALENLQKPQIEALCADRHTIDTISCEKLGERGRHRLGIGLDGHLRGGRQGT
jgi:hypothetical protein